jgi:hypothetical protein
VNDKGRHQNASRVYGDRAWWLLNRAHGWHATNPE